MSPQSDDKTADRLSPPKIPDRITVSLIAKAAADLQRLHEHTGMSRTDITNRAISLYQFIEAQRQAGCDMLIRDSQTGEVQIVRFA